MAHSNFSRRQLLGCLLSAQGMLSGLPSASAATVTLPDVPYRIVVGISPGSGLDAMARLLARYLGSTTGRHFLVENKPGANGLIAAESVARHSGPDIRIYMGLTSHLLLNQLLYRRLPLDLRKDLKRLYLLSAGSIYLTVNRNKLPVNNLQELVAHIRRHRGQLSYGSLGQGSYPHLIGARLNQLTGGDLLHIPYQGEAPMIGALLSGELDMGWASPLPLLQHAQVLQPLAGNGPERMSTMPEVPTFAEAGMPDEAFGLRGWVGLAVPARTADPIAVELGRAIARTVASTDLAHRSRQWAGAFRSVLSGRLPALAAAGAGRACAHGRPSRCQELPPFSARAGLRAATHTFH